jgi:hypothetical protein
MAGIDHKHASRYSGTISLRKEGLTMQTKARNSQGKHQLYDESLCELNSPEGLELSEEILTTVTGGANFGEQFGKFALTEFGKTSIAGVAALGVGTGAFIAGEHIRKSLHS